MHPSVKVTPYRVGLALHTIHKSEFYYSRKGREKKTAFYYKLCLIEPPHEVSNILPMVLKHDMSTQCNLDSKLSLMQKEKEQLLRVISLESSNRLQSVSSKDLIQSTRISQKSVLNFGDNLGKGTFGTVTKGTYKANDSGHSIPVAIKQPRDLSNRIIIESIMQEIRILHFIKKSSKHFLQHLIGVIYDESERNTPMKVVSEFIGRDSQSTTVSHILANEHTLKRFNITTANWLKVCSSLCSALMYLHNNLGLLHNDLKSNNVLVRLQRLSAVLIDFGKACPIVKAKRKTTLKDDTHVWIAPEVLDGTTTYTTHSDIFSLGYIYKHSLSSFSKSGYLTTIEEMANLCQDQKPLNRPSLLFVAEEFERRQEDI